MAGKPQSRGKRGGSTIGSAVFWLFSRVLAPLALLYGLLWWRTGVAIDRQLDSLRPYLDIRHGRTVLGLNGDVGLRDLVVRPRPGTPMPAVTLTADRAVLRTPGLLWVLRSAVFGVPDGIPSRIGFSLSGAGLDGSPEAMDAAMVGGHVLFPFDLAGCEPRLGLEVANALGLRDATSDFSAMLEYGGADHLRLKIDSETPKQAKIAGDINFGLGAGGDPGLRLATAGFESLSFTIEDLGFGAARNAHCAQKLGVSTDEFVQAHLQAVRARFAAQGLVPGAAMEQAYAGFAARGGKLVINARPLRAGPLVQWQGVGLEGLGLFVDATVKHDDNFAAPLVFLPADQFAAAPGAADAAVAVPPDAAVPTEQAQDAASAGLAPGAELVFEDLPAHLGALIEVSTRIGTVRRGVLTGASSLGIVLKLAPEDGGFPLSMPKYNIVGIRLAPPPNETPETQANAQAQ